MVADGMTSVRPPGPRTAIPRTLPSGERKGTLSVLIDDETARDWGPVLLKSYRLTVQQMSQALDDPWPADVDTTLGSGHSIIHEPLQDVSVYLKNIQLLWKLGRKPYHRSTNP